MIEGLAACFAGLTDPRETSRCDHQLVDILAIAVCAVVACAESWEDIELYGRSKQAWLGTFLALPNGIPSHDTFRRVFMLLDPDAFEACFSRWAQSLAVGVKREVVAVDGKAVRRSGSRRHDHRPLHLVSAWASEQGLALGQRAVDGKSNEITAIPELLDTLRLEGCIVTLDAMGCRKEIAERIRVNGADYLLVLKANHGHAFEAVREHFEHTCFGLGSGGRRCWRWRRSAASPAAARSRPRSATSSPAAATIPPSWSKPSAGTGASRTRCTGSSTSPSARTTVACATAPLPATSPSCARSPSTSSLETAAAKPAYAAGARRPPGTTPTCSRSSPTRLMREPCLAAQPDFANGIRPFTGQATRSPALPGIAGPYISQNSTLKAAVRQGSLRTSFGEVARAGRLRPGVHAGAGPRPAARCPADGRLRQGVRGEGVRRAARAAGPADCPWLHAPGR